MGKLIIRPEILALKAEREALEKRKEQDRVPPRVAAFWFAQEADVPAWRRETSEERERREELESTGVRVVACTARDFIRELDERASSDRLGS